MEGTIKQEKKTIIGNISSVPMVDSTLTYSGYAADAKVVGDKFLKVSPEYAHNVTYDNATSGLVATDVQGAVDEIGKDFRFVNGIKEWMNPPSEVGVEYRTIERFDGKPVYYKRLSIGALPHNDVKWAGHGITNMGYVVDFGGVTVQGDFTKVLSLPYCLNSSYYGRLSVTHENIVVATSGITAEEASAYSRTIVWIKYTKKTD